MSRRRLRPFFVLVACLFVVAGSVPAVLAAGVDRGSPAPAFPTVEMSAPNASAVVVDDATGAVVYDRDAHRRRAPASITKIATALVALRYDDPSRLVTVHVDWWDLRDSTLMGVFRGERLTIEDLLYGLMLPSGNDAAVAIARAVAGSETSFVRLMNRQVWDLGLIDTHFANPHGLDEQGHFTSAYDMAMLARYAMRDPVFRRVVRAKTVEVSGLSHYALRNINRFVWYYPDGDGVKNGYTDDAGLTVVATAERGGRRAYAVVMGSWDYAGDAARLLDAYFATYGSRPPEVSFNVGPYELTRVEPDESPPHKWIDVAPSRVGHVRRSLKAQ